MREAEVLSDLVGLVYDAALEPSLWPNALGKAAQFVGGSSAALYSKDASSKSGNVFYDDGSHDRHYVELYFDRCVKLDPATTGHFFAEIGEPVATADLIPYAEFLETRFYKEWAQPQGLVDFVSAILEKSVTSIASFGVFRHQRHGQVDDETRCRMRMVIPHVRRAVLIGKIVELKTVHADNLAEALHAISAGMFLVEASGRIVHANAAGHDMLAEGGVLRAHHGRLAASDAAADRALHDSFRAAAEGDLVLGIGGVAVPLTGSGGERYVAHVLPLTSGRRRTGHPGKAVAALFVHRATMDIRSPPEIIARHYGLTPTELRVLLAIVEVGGAPEVAEALGIAETTVKFHLRNLFEKTETHRQADLVRLVAGFCNPLVGWKQ